MSVTIRMKPQDDSEAGRQLVVEFPRLSSGPLITQYSSAEFSFERTSVSLLRYIAPVRC